MRISIFLACLLSLSAHAGQILSGSLDGVSNYSIDEQATVRGVFAKINAPGIQMSKTVGAPELPVRSFIVKGTPGAIVLSVEVKKAKVLNDTLVNPVQKEDCRCETGDREGFQFSSAAYERMTKQFEVTYLGAFRGQAISKIDLYLARHDGANRTLEIQEQLEISSNAELFEMPRDEYKDYLIIGPANLLHQVQDFVSWKRASGYNVLVEGLQAPQLSKEAIQAIIKNHYEKNGTDFVIFVGDERTLPQFYVHTSASSKTPSDLQYLTMDGEGDYIPDMFSSRIVASSADDVAVRLSKSTEFEKKSFKNKDGLSRVIGVASNEGSNPSDDEYVRSIGDKFAEVLNYTAVHFHQNDKKSTPEELNNAYNAGAAWMTYMGHGSGTGWSSMYRGYNVTDIKSMRNVHAVKPILIDVACQNGQLIPGNLGAGFDAILDDSAGASAYYGGSVNISWHPPAIMARGIAFEHLSKNFAHLGEALLAGQLYLAENYASTAAVIDNMEWYHLQGDPGMRISH